jgi:hypothetical protein
MSDDDVELGPIDYLVVEWPADRQPTGEAFPLLVDLVDRGLIRVLDLAFVHKEEDGSIVGINIGDLEKCLSNEAFQVAAEARAFLSERGVDLSGQQETKTKKALEFFSKELSGSTTQA